MQNAIEQILSEVEAGRFREAGAMIERSLSEHPQEILPYRVNLANWLLLAANWPLITRLPPPGSNFFVESGWLESVLREKPVDKSGAPIPWYTYRVHRTADQTGLPRVRVRQRLVHRVVGSACRKRVCG